MNERSAVRLESTERPPEEHERLRTSATMSAVSSERDDATENEEVIAHLVDLFDAAVDPSDGAVDDR